MQAERTSQHADAPPGNNGTVKIDEFPADAGNDNDAHVDCRFSVSFFGYDAGNQQATMVFEPWAPTNGGKTTTLTTSWTTASRTGGNQLDKSFGPVDLTSAFAGVAPAAQGYHVKLTVHVTGSQGADVKHKVFWFQPCESATKPAVQPAATGTAAQPTTATAAPAAMPATVPTAAPAPAVAAQTTTASASTPASDQPPAQVLAERFTAAPAASVAAGTAARPGTGAVHIGATGAAGASGALPFTGSHVGTLVAAAVSLLVLGGLTWLGARWKAHRA